MRYNCTLDQYRYIVLLVLRTSHLFHTIDKLCHQRMMNNHRKCYMGIAVSMDTQQIHTVCNLLIRYLICCTKSNLDYKLNTNDNLRSLYKEYKIQTPNSFQYKCHSLDLIRFQVNIVVLEHTNHIPLRLYNQNTNLVPHTFVK